MAVADHLLRFRLMSTEDLQAKKLQLEGQESIFSQQSIGSKSATRDLRLLYEQLNAIANVLAERGIQCVVKAPFNNSVGTVDFSGVNGGTSGYPAGTTENL